MLLRLLMMGALALALLFVFRKDARSYAAKSGQYYSFEEVLTMHGAENFKIEKLGEFQTKYDGDPWSGKPMKSWCYTPSEKVTIICDSTRSLLKIDKMRFRLDRMKTKPGGYLIGKGTAIDAEGSSLYRLVAKGDTFSLFYSGNLWACGSTSRIAWVYVINHRLHSINIFETYPTFHYDTPLWGDINNDSVPEFLCPKVFRDKYNHIVDLDGPVWMNLIPYEQDSTGNYVPSMDSAGSFIHYKYVVDFQRQLRGENFIRER